KQRDKPQVVEDQPVPTFDGRVTGNQVIAHTWTELACYQCCSPRNEAVDDNRYTLSCCCQDDADQPGNLQPAHPGEYVEWVCGVRAVVGKCTLNHIYFMSALLISDACAIPGHRCHRCACQDSSDCTRSRRVADAHIAGCH